MGDDGGKWMVSFRLVQKNPLPVDGPASRWQWSKRGEYESNERNRVVPGVLYSTRNYTMTGPFLLFSIILLIHMFKWFLQAIAPCVVGGTCPPPHIYI